MFQFTRYQLPAELFSQARDENSSKSALHFPGSKYVATDDGVAFTCSGDEGLDFFKDYYAFYIVNLFAGGEAFGWVRDFQGEGGAIACLFVSGDDV